MQPSTIPLFARWPELAVLPHCPLVTGPTPVHPLDRLLAGRTRGRLWVKRDDRTSGLYGGNKPRKLEFLIADALRRGASSLLTTGGIGSNHALATCLHAASTGLPTHVLLFPQPVTDHVRMSLKLFARHARSMILGTTYEELPAMVERFQALHPGTYWIPAGGSTAVGALGFVNAAIELADQVRAGELPEPGRILLAAGTCGTLAGLTVGLKLAGLSTRPVGIRVIDRAVANPDTVVALAHGVLEILETAAPSLPRVRVGPADFDLDESYYGPGYGHPTPEGLAAAEAMRADEGIALEPTYTAKAMAAVLDAAAGAPPDKPVLFWNTFAGPVLEDQAREVPDEAIPPQFLALLRG